jgi:hypothetical protein
MFEYEGDVGRIACHHHPMARKSLAIASKRVTALLHNRSRDSNLSADINQHFINSITSETSN